MVCSVVTTGRGFVVFLRRFLLLVLFLFFVWFGCGRATGSGWIVLQLRMPVTRTVKAVGYTTATACDGVSCEVLLLSTGCVVVD